MKPKACWLCVPALLAAAVAFAETKTYHIGTNPARTNIVFESKTDVEDIVGSTNAAAGIVVANREEPAKSTVRITVPVRSLKTGIVLRDQHLQGADWLNAAKNPNITFVSNSVSAGAKPGELNVTGTFTMAGVPQTKTVAVTWREIPDEAATKAGLGPGSWIRFETSFPVRLSEHGVAIPADSALKVSDEIRINVSLFCCTSPAK